MTVADAGSNSESQPDRPQIVDSNVYIQAALQCNLASNGQPSTYYYTGLPVIWDASLYYNQFTPGVWPYFAEVTQLDGSGRARIKTYLTGGSFNAPFLGRSKRTLYGPPASTNQAIVTWERSDDGGASWTAVATSRQFEDGEPFEMQASPLVRDWRMWTVSHEFGTQGRTSGDIRFRVQACLSYANQADENLNQTATQTTATFCTRGRVTTVPISAVGIAPQLSVAPKPTMVLANQTANFTATLTGTPLPTWRWQTRPANTDGTWTDVGNAAVGGSASLTTPLLALADNGRQYRLVASNPAGQLASPPVTVSVTPAPVPVSISTQPGNLAVTRSGDAVFAVTATGTEPLSYQWRRNGQPVPGANASVLRLNQVVDADNGAQFSVSVSNAAGSVTSQSAQLSVLPAGSAALAAPSIVTQPANVTARSGQTVTFAVGVNGTSPFNFQWRKNGNPISGANAAVFTLAAAAAGDAGSYTVVVSNGAGSVTSSTAVLDMLADPPPPQPVAPSITTQPSNVVALSGTGASFAVAATGNGPLSYQWARNGVDLQGAIGPILTLPMVQGSNAGSYTVRVSNSAGSVTSNAATLIVPGAPAITQQPTSQTVNLGQTAAFTLGVSGNPVPQCQWTRNGIAIIGATSCTGYTTPPAGTADIGAVYNVVVYSPGGVAFGGGAALTVLIAPPQILTESGNRSVAAGSPASFSVTATGTDITFQWFRNNLAILGETSDSYTLSNPQSADNGATFRVQVCNSALSGGQCVTSSPMLLSVSTGSVTAGPPASVGACFGGTSGWCYLSPAPMANRLYGLAFDSIGSGVTIVGGSGTVLRSPDFGGTVTAAWMTPRQHFRDVVSPYAGRLIAVSGPNDNGFVAPNTGGVWVSDDAGTSWTQLVVMGQASGLAFQDASQGVAVGADRIVRTTDGGSSWTTASLPAGSFRLFTAVAYAGNNTYVAVGNGIAMRSVDGGQTWTDVSSPYISASYLTGVVFNGNGVGIMSNCTGDALRTTDSGATWSPLSLPDAACYLAFADTSTALLIGTFGDISRSTDAGASWGPVTPSPDRSQQIWRPFMRNAQQGIAVGLFGAIARTSDGGQSWTQVSGGSINWNIDDLVANPSRTILIGRILSRLQVSTDNGATWTDPSNGQVGGGRMSWGSDAVASNAGEFYGVSISTDGGNTWNQVRSETSTRRWRTGAMASPSVGVFVGYDQVGGQFVNNQGTFIARTTDAGSTWTETPAPVQGIYLSARFITPTLGFLGGANALLLRTTDGGMTWSQITLPAAGTNNGVDQIRQIRASPSGAIYAITDSALLRSTDQGVSFTRVLNSTNSGSMNDVSFRDANVGFAVGVGGVWRSTDGGTSWTNLNLPLDDFMSAAAWAGNGDALAGGWGGVLLRNSSGGALAVQPQNPTFKQTLRVSPKPRPVVPSSGPRSARRELEAGARPELLELSRPLQAQAAITLQRTATGQRKLQVIPADPSGRSATQIRTLPAAPSRQ
jgi:photosystem II stability/assembly factor-like uncharacterized protein